MQTVVIWYLIIINLLTFVVFGRDKRRATGHGWRISEKQLYILTGLGGFVGALVAMQIFRHKTIKPSFIIRFGGIVVLWIIGLLLYLFID